MNKSSLHICIAAMTLLLAGCYPEDFVWWSPNGQTAAIRTSEGLRLANTNGELSTLVLPGEIHSAAWLRDSSALIINRSVIVTNWGEAQKLLPPEEVESTLQTAKAIPDLLKAAFTASGGNIQNLDEKFLTTLGISDLEPLEPAFACAASIYRAQIMAVLSQFTNSATLQNELLSSQTNGISIHQITLMKIQNGRPSGKPLDLLCSQYRIVDPVVSPGHPMLAYRSAGGSLTCLSLDGKNSQKVAHEDVASAVWSADGRALIYVVKGKTDKIGEIRSRKVLSESGEILQNAPQPETLALAAFFMDKAPPRLAVLPDGRVLFASVPVALPAQAAGLQPHSQFFLLNPANPNAAPSDVNVTEGSLPEDLNAFSVSPDGRFVAVVEAGTDVVAVLELATGKVKFISQSHEGWKSRMIPAWRNNHELAFAGLPSPDVTRPELILWQDKAPECVLSKEWPTNVVEPWLEHPQKASHRPR